MCHDYSLMIGNRLFGSYTDALLITDRCWFIKGQWSKQTPQVWCAYTWLIQNFAFCWYPSPIKQSVTSTTTWECSMCDLCQHPIDRWKLHYRRTLVDVVFYPNCSKLSLCLTSQVTANTRGHSEHTKCRDLIGFQHALHMVMLMMYTKINNGSNSSSRWHPVNHQRATRVTRRSSYWCSRITCIMIQVQCRARLRSLYCTGTSVTTDSDLDVIQSIKSQLQHSCSYWANAKWEQTIIQVFKPSTCRRMQSSLVMSCARNAIS